MQHYQTTRFFILTALLCTFISVQLLSQVKIGFQFLAKKDTISAEKAFTKDLGKAKKAMAAQYGLLRIREGNTQEYPIDTLLLFSDSLQTMQAKLSKLSYWRKRKYNKKYKLTPQYAKILRDKILAKTAKKMGDEWGVLAYDDLAKQKPTLVKEMGYALKRALKKIVIRDYDKAFHYETLRSVIKNHGLIIQNQNLRFSQDFEARLSSSFINQYGISRLGEFIKEFPQHGITSDCWVKELIQAYQQSGRRGGLQFLNQYRFSKLDIFVISDILMHRNELVDLAPAEQERLDALLLNTTIERSLLRKYDSDTLFDKTLKYIKLEAPSRRSFSVLKKSMQRLVDSGNIALATRLLDSTKILYKIPEAQRGCAFTIQLSWFDTIKAILQRPDTNISKIPLKAINTVWGHEFSPVISANGKTLYFCGSDRPNMGDNDGEKVFVSYWKDNQWTTPVLVKELAVEGNQSPLSLTPDGLTLLLSVNGKLCVSTRTNGKWATPTPLSSINESFAWVGKATLSPDSRVLIFEASKDINPYSSTADIDLYMAFKQGSTWNFSKPTPLSNSINRPYTMERSPYLHTDGKTLYFASDGHEGMGEIDIFKTTRLDNSWQKWSKPYNIGKNFNTIYDDWGMNLAITSRGDFGIFSSNYNQWDNNNIYITNVPQEIQPEKMQVIELKIKQPANKKTTFLMTIYNAKNQIIKRDSVRIEDGQILAAIPQDSAHHFVIENDQTFPVNGTIASVALTLDTIRMVAIADMLDKNVAVPIPNIEFDKNKAVLRQESFYQLDNLVPFFAKKPWVITITGHTDDTGVQEHNTELSLQRAQSVADYLKIKLPDLVIHIQGMGSAKPKTTGISEEARQANRRVEIKIQKTK